MRKHKGFTIVELLVVIVVVGILASVSIVAYSGVQARARDAQRLHDLKSIEKALDLYKTQFGSYPAHTSTPNGQSWELSSSGDFLSPLKEVISAVPIDPANTHTSGIIANNSPNKVYFYYRYAAGTNGADPKCGGYYILGATRFDTVKSGQLSSDSPKFSTPNRNWNDVGAYTTGGYENC